MTTDNNIISSIAQAAAELGRRRLDALELYRLTQKQEEILRSAHNVRQFLLLGGNRAGKSHTAAVRFAALARGRQLVCADGRRIDVLKEDQKGRPLLMWVIGLQMDHIGQTLHRLLFRPGLFDLVRDKKTGYWRAWYPPLYPEDFDIPKSKRRPSPPLIPPHEIEKWAWDKFAERQFSLCRLKNGNEIYAFASSAPVKAGDPVDEIWIDEAIKFASHYPEWLARLVDREGRLFWSSWPARNNSALRQLNRQCEEEAKQLAAGEREYVTAAKAVLRMSDNPFFTKKQIEDTLAGWDETERRARDRGEFVTDQIRLYTEYDPELHRIDRDMTNAPA